MTQNDMDVMLAKAQIGLAFMFAIAIFAMVFVLIFFHEQINPTSLTIITTVITALVTILTLMANFFYARSRPAALPDPTPPPTIVPAGSTLVAPSSPSIPASSPTAAIVAAPLDPTQPEKKI